MRTIPVWAALAAVLLAAPARAFWPFGESEEEQAAALATHVAESLREPIKTIALAQDATEAGDTEEAIRLFRKAQGQLEAIEAAEDTSDSAWSALRIKKFQCISALDALALKRAFSERLEEGDVMVIDNFDLPDHKTRSAVAVLKNLQIADETVMLSVNTFSEAAICATGNLPMMVLRRSATVNTYELLRFKKLVFTKEALDIFIDRLA